MKYNVSFHKVVGLLWSIWGGVEC